MKNKIRRNSICPCGCGRKFKVCNTERLEREEKERYIALKSRGLSDDTIKFLAMSAVFGGGLK